MGRGDSEFVDNLDALNQFWEQDYTCHYASRPEHCADVFVKSKLEGGDVIKKYLSLMWLTEFPSRYAQVQNNDECVKDTISETKTYWDYYI